MGRAIPSQVNEQPEYPLQTGECPWRLLNTEEYLHRRESGRLPPREEMLTFLWHVENTWGHHRRGFMIENAPERWRTAGGE